MPKENGIKHNNMNFNVLPPAIDGGNTDDCPENLGNPYITQLIRPLLNRHQRQVAALSRHIEALRLGWIVNKRSIHQNGGKIKAYVQIMHTWYSRDAF